MKMKTELKTQFMDDWVNHSSFLKIKEYPDKFELTMRAVRDKLHHGRYTSLDGKSLESETYRVIFWKILDKG